MEDVAPPGPGQTGKFQVYPFFAGTDAACTNAVYLLPPAFRYGAAFAAFPVGFLYVGSSTTLPDALSGNADFTLSFTGGGKPPYTQGNVAAQVTITGANAWAGAPQTRQTLMANFTAFLLSVEALETAGTLIPGAARLIGSRIADQMPVPLAEAAFWRSGLSTGTYPGTLPYVDVRPGMRLRVDGASSQFLDPGAPQNAYVLGSRVSFDVGSAPAGPGLPRSATFDALLATIKAPAVAPPSAPAGPSAPTPAAGVVDLDPLGGARPYWRLIYPATVPSPLDPGGLGVTDGVVLVGAPTLAALEAATKAYPATPAGGTPANVYLAFTGRALPVPEIPVFVTLRGVPQMRWVAVGTTLANLIEPFGPLPLDPGTASSIGFLRPTAFSSTGSPTTPLALTTSDPTGVPLPALPPGMFDLTLMAGDGITLGV